MTAEAADEVTGVQEYVAALATHDLCCANAVHAVAAFDLASPYVHDIATGMVDWSCFLSPAQHHIWHLVYSTPLSWIYLPAPHSLPLPSVQVMPPTIHLSAGLHGRGKRAFSRSVAAGSGGGDGPNRSASTAQPGASSSGMRILKRPALAMTQSPDNHTHLAPRAPILRKPAFSTTDALAKDTLWRATCTQFGEWVRAHEGRMAKSERYDRAQIKQILESSALIPQSCWAPSVEDYAP